MDPRRDTLLAPPLEAESTVTGEIEGQTDADRQGTPEHHDAHHDDAVAQLRGVRPLTRPPFRPWASVHDQFDPTDE